MNLNNILKYNKIYTQQITHDYIYYKPIDIYDL